MPARALARLLAALLVVLGAPPAGAQGATCAPRLSDSPVSAFVGVDVVPLDRDTVLRNHTVVVRDGRIAAVGPVADLPVPPGAARIDARGRWLMPGLVDAHFHLTSHRGINEAVLLLALAKGTTAVMELGGDTLSLALRDEIAGGRVLGPAMYVAGPHLRDSAMTRVEGSAFADRHRAAGYDLIKIYNPASAEGYRGMMLRAHQLGIPTIGHVPRSMGLEGTLGAGQRGIAHIEEYLYTYFGVRFTDTAQVASARLDSVAIPYLARITREAETWVTPTLVTFGGIVALTADPAAELAKPAVQYVPALLFDALWAPWRNSYQERFSHPRQREGLRAGLDFQRRMVGAFHREGVPLLVGTDGLVAGVVPGFGMHEELRNLVEAGLSPYEALAAATRNAGEFLGRADEIGTVQAGGRADLLLLSRNPLDDVRGADAIAGVMVRGRWVDGTQLAEVLQCLRAGGPGER